MFLEKVYSGRNQWYFYIFSLLIIFTATQIGSLPLVGYMIMEDPSILQGGDISAATSTNTGLALTLLSFAVGFFTILFCVKYIFFGDTSHLVFQFEPVHFLILVVISLLLFPFQTSFEELLFRGYLMQWSALLFKYRWVAVVITGVLFGILHGANPEVEEFGMWVALPQYILMGLILGFVAVKDDGMELSLGLHMANNIIAAITITSDSSTLQTHALFKDLHPTASHFDTLTMLVAGVIFIWICNRKYHFWGKICLWKKIQKESNEM